MILSDQSIIREIEQGNIIIDPFNREYLNPNSIDLTLAPEFKVYTKKQISWGVYAPLDPKKPNPVQTIEVPEEGYTLMPGEVYLYACNERIGVRGNLRGKVEGKSSLGRLGLFIHICAGFIDTGFEGSLVLELVATRPIIVYPNMKICQIEFARVEGEILETYDQKKGSKYQNQKLQESKYHENF
jgi:dCTP deaminase